MRGLRACNSEESGGVLIQADLSMLNHGLMMEYARVFGHVLLNHLLICLFQMESNCECAFPNKSKLR